MVLFGIILLLCIYLSYKRKQFHINQWKKSLNLAEHSQVFLSVYQKTNGFFLSQKARQKQDALDYVYGEIEFVSFSALLSLVGPDEHTIFYDLGCGIGKAVLACAMVYPIEKSVGIEVLPELYFAACKQINALKVIEAYRELSKKIEFIHGDFFEVNLDEATLIFINATALFNPTWQKLCARIDNLPYLKCVITTSKALCCVNFSVIKKTQVEMSWGVVRAFVHTRKKNIY
jgi:SAM-dependent methyltransferase